jgi:segregation and condensation protein B
MSDVEPTEATPQAPSLEPAQQLRLLEAILFASAEPMTYDMLEQQLGPGCDLGGLLMDLREHYADHGVNLVEIDGRWGFRTAGDLAPHMKITRQPRRKLPRAAAEVLAIIAYHQPVTRAEIESVRGVDTSKGTLDILLETGWVRPGKRRETPGRPLTWITTPEFLSHYNISSINELPGLDDLKAAGLLDARPVLATLPQDQQEAESSRDEDDFADWLDEPAANAAAG